MSCMKLNRKLKLDNGWLVSRKKLSQKRFSCRATKITRTVPMSTPAFKASVLKVTARTKLASVKLKSVSPGDGGSSRFRITAIFAHRWSLVYRILWPQQQFPVNRIPRYKEYLGLHQKIFVIEPPVLTASGQVLNSLPIFHEGGGASFGYFLV